MAGTPTIQQLMKHLDRSEKTIHQYKKRGMPVSTLREAKEWQKKHVRMGPAAPGEASDDLTAARIAKTQEEARYKRLQNEQLEENLVERDKVMREITAWCVRFKTRLMQLPDRIAVIVPEELKAVIKDQVEDAIIALLKEAYGAEICDAEVRQLILDEAERVKDGSQSN